MKLITKLPDAMLIVAGILILMLVMTWIVPAGEFDRVEKNGRELVVEGSYHTVEPAPQGIKSLFTAPLKGFESAAHIIGFVLLIGGAFTIVDRTGAIRAGLFRVVQFCKEKPRSKNLIIPLIIVFFSLCGATFGMSEESLVFILITIPLSLSLGYDSIVGVAIPFVGAGAGFAGAFINPFTLQIAQGIAELQPLSGWEYRLFVWAVFTLIAIIFIMRYARKVEKDPKSSLVFGIETRDLGNTDQRIDGSSFTTRRIIILIGFLASIILLVVGAVQWDWYIEEISGLFIALGIFAALVEGMKTSEAVKAFYDGAKDMIAAALIIGLAKAIVVVAEDGKIIDTILHAVSSGAKDLPVAVSVQVMFLVQSAINFFVPSGSGQAAMTMPIMAPLGDLIGISRQTSVLAYQFGDGLSNLIIPTSYVTMGILAVAKIPYEKWFRWILPLMVILFITAMLLLIPPVTLFNFQ